MSEQIQCCLRFFDDTHEASALTIRLMSVELDEWEAMKEAQGSFDFARGAPILTNVLRSPWPILLSREELLLLQGELEEHGGRIEQLLEGAAWDAFFTLDLFVEQAASQREAGVSFEVWAGAYFENQVFLQPGADILSDAEELKRWLPPKE
jgi:hypothetical protein